MAGNLRVKEVPSLPPETATATAAPGRSGSWPTTAEANRHDLHRHPLGAADALFAAEQAVGRAGQMVEDLQTTIISALRVLDDAESDSAKARLGHRRDFYLEAAIEHLGRLQTRCSAMPELTQELDDHLTHASRAIAWRRSRRAQLWTTRSPMGRR